MIGWFVRSFVRLCARPFVPSVLRSFIIFFSRLGGPGLLTLFRALTCVSKRDISFSRYLVFSIKHHVGCCSFYALRVLGLYKGGPFNKHLSSFGYGQSALYCSFISFSRLSPVPPLPRFLFWPQMLKIPLKKLLPLHYRGIWKSHIGKADMKRLF